MAYKQKAKETGNGYLYLKNMKSIYCKYESIKISIVTAKILEISILLKQFVNIYIQADDFKITNTQKSTSVQLISLQNLVSS
jgi:hypothetical protein